MPAFNWTGMPGEREDDDVEMLSGEEEEEEEEEDDSPLPLKFRNYVPGSEKLKAYILPHPTLPNIVEEIDFKLQKAIEANRTRDVLNLAPRKANWDLKRDLSKRLEVLEGRTQRAIVQMVRQKFQEQANSEQGMEKKLDALYRTEMS